MRNTVALTSTVILDMLVAGCSSNGTTSETHQQTQQNNPSQPPKQQIQPSQDQTQLNNPPQLSQQNDSSGLVSVTYSLAIQQLAKQDKILPYVPTKILDGDEYESAVGSLTLNYKKMIINQSNQSGGGGVILQREDVKLSNGFSAQWIQIEGKAGSPYWVLYLKQEIPLLPLRLMEPEINRLNRSQNLLHH